MIDASILRQLADLNLSDKQMTQVVAIFDTAGSAVALDGWPPDAAERFWQQYPLKVAKRAAMKALDRARKRVTFDVLMAGLHRYIQGQNPEFYCHATTWLNGDRWFDEVQNNGSLPVSAVPPTKQDGSLISFAPANVRLALAQRLIFSEALEAVGGMLRSYPPSEGIDQSGYIGTLAAALMQYPPCVARKCADPIRGVARTNRFRPTVADVIGWCEREIGELRDIVARQAREREQFEVRRRAAKDAAELASARAQRLPLDALRQQYGQNWGLKGMDNLDELKGTVARGQKQAACERGHFEATVLADYRRRGLEPSYTFGGLVTPSLMVALGKISERPPATVPPAPRHWDDDPPKGDFD